MSDDDHAAHMVASATAAQNKAQALEPAAPSHGIEPGSLAEIRALCERTPGLERLWLYGSRAAGTHRARSDIDLAADAPGWTSQEAFRFIDALNQLPMVYPVDCVWWQSKLGDVFKEQITLQRAVLWEPSSRRLQAQPRGAVIDFKPFQERVLARLGDYLDALKTHATTAERARTALRAMEGMEEVLRDTQDYPRKAWTGLKSSGQLPPAFASLPHSSRFSGAGAAIPNICLKVPTGGGKTLLAAASVGQVFSRWFNRHTGLVLWVVPNDAIYRQTLKTLGDRDHPYRQLLNVAGAGRVKILEKTSPLTRQDVDGHLCVMVLMLASAARQSKETLRFFRDRGNVLGFLPREDDVEAHWELIQQVPNLDVYAPFGQSQETARATRGSVVKTSLGNVMRLLRPMVVVDEGHHGYSENALNTLDGFNPGFLLELSATPRVANPNAGKGKPPTSGSNILVDVRGTDLDEAQMIKLPIHVDVQHWSDWQSCLAASVTKLDTLQREADALRGETSRYIRPILLVQVERTGADLRDAGYIHAEDAKAYLLQLGLSDAQIAVKTSEKDELKAPENIDLLSPTCEVRAIITKQALQEGWDCPFAYVLCALAAGRNPGAMTQLVGRILRQPGTAKTGREALDACYVLCHDAQTGSVVKAIKASLEGEGMGDLALAVTGASGDAGSADGRIVHQTRRPELAPLGLFLPRVTWVPLAAAREARRELSYESDVLADIDWSEFNGAALTEGWSPNRDTPLGETFDIVLNRQGHGTLGDKTATATAPAIVDRARLVRALLDIVPNAWLVWDWVQAAVAALIARGLAETALAVSSASLIEHLRQALEAERDRRAEQVFMQRVAEGRIEFALRADRCDYELPRDADLAISGQQRLLVNLDDQPATKSLLAPVYESADLNGFEATVAAYLDSKHAVRWWHRNVARTQYGLQGWRRHRVYPDFVFGLASAGGEQRLVLLETKGVHLAGSSDTHYKQDLLQRLTVAYQDARWQDVGSLELTDANRTVVACDLLLDVGWQGALEHRWFAQPHDAI